jgi:hypothetical protein
LSEETWGGHILVDHQEITEQDFGSVRETLKDPDYVVREERPTSASSIYYRDGGCKTFPKLRLAVIVQWQSEDHGLVKTAYATKSPKRQGEIEWVRRAPK